MGSRRMIRLLLGERKRCGKGEERGGEGVEAVRGERGKGEGGVYINRVVGR